MSTERRHPNVINQDELDVIEVKKGKHHGRMRRFGPTAGSQHLGGSIMELPPGAVSFPYHYHCNNEEAIYVLSGTGTARIGEKRVPVRAGDWIAYPVGPDHAHQIVNDSREPLVYLMLSTMHTCEVVGYPDSNKVAMWGGERDKPWVRQVVRAGESLDYFEGEPLAKE